MKASIEHINRLTSQLALVCAMLCLGSCNREDAPDCFQSAGEYSSEKRTLEAFNTIELNDYIQYELCDTTFYGVEITAPKNLISDIETKVLDGKLAVHNSNSCNFVRSYKNRMTVRIYAPEFRDIQNYSTGDITSTNTINDELFSLENRGAAGVQRLMLHCDTVNLASHTGVSDAILIGQCDVVKLFSQGLGIVDARDLSANYAFVNNSSLNDIFVQSHS
ncbi:MAG: GIN domain-containing protein, partial [Flavobacteriales bacterium]